MDNSRRERHPIFARLYPLMGRAMDGGGMAERRRALLAGLAGEVVEVGAGDGLNFPHYPPTSIRVRAVEPEPHLRGLAAHAARRAPVPVEVVDGIAERLPVEDGSADAVVVSLVLCCVRDEDKALREIHRVLRPGGQLRFLEHVREQAQAEIAQVDAVMRTLDELRESAGMTKADLARLIGKDPAVVRRLLTADAPDPEIITVAAMARAVGAELRIVVPETA